MADISFDDLIPQKAAAPAQISFDDLIPDGKKKPTGILKTIDDYMGMAAKGLSFGLADRIGAAGDAMVGRGSYDENLARNRGVLKQIETDHPIAAPVTETVAGMAGPLGAIGAIGKGATLLQKAGAGAVAGGAYGGVQGAADSSDFTNVGDTAKHAAMGAGIGAMGGASLPFIARGVGAGYNAMADAVRGGAPGITSAAASHVLPAFTADGPQAVSDALQKLGPHGMLADAGPALLGKAQGASLNSDDARSILANALLGRNRGANGRIQGEVDSALGPAPSSAQQATADILASRSAGDNINYPRSLDNAPPVDTTGVLATVGQALNQAVPGTMEHKALSNMKTMLMSEKQVPKVDPTTGAPMFDNVGNAITEARPVPRDNAGQLHKLKVELDNVIHYDQPGLGVPAGALQNQQGALKMVRGQLNGALESQVPGYAEANSASSNLAKQAEAVKLGTSLLDSGKTALTPADLTKQFQGMSDGERQALSVGLRHEIERQLDTKANDLVAGKNVIKGEGDWNRERLAMVFGQEPTDRVINHLDAESKFRDTYNKVVENSQTAQRTAAASSMKPSPATETPLVNPNMTIAGTIGTIGKKLLGSAVNSMRGDPTKSYGEVAKVLSAQGPERDAFLAALGRALSNREQNASMAPVIGNRAALAAVLSGDAYRRHLQQQR